MKIMTKILVLLLLLGSPVYCKVSMPVPGRYVEDKAGVIDSAAEQKLNGLLQELEQKTGAQYIVLTVKSLNNIPIETFTIELAEQWKLGSAKEDNGMLFVLSLQDKEYRFEVGYGLESTITDVYAGKLGREYLVPYAKKGDISQGIYLANAAIAQRIAQAKGVTLTGMPKLTRPQRKSRPGGFLFGLLPIILFLLIGGRRGLFLYFLLGGLGGGRYGYGGSSYRSSSFGGGFGSFGGGGGGGFGGGGASGSW